MYNGTIRTEYLEKSNLCVYGNWFKSYLHNRQQYCSLNGKKSKNREVTCGIPQGSCLGPLLFILYLNDFERCLKYSKANIYADDTNITIASNDKEKLVADAQAELHNITEWMRVNKLVGQRIEVIKKSQHWRIMVLLELLEQSI